MSQSLSAHAPRSLSRAAFPSTPPSPLCRVLALDGGHLSFTELFFHTRNAPLMRHREDAAAADDPAWQAAYEERGWAVTSLDPAAAVLDHIALITSPPDARYSPLGPPAAHVSKQQQQKDEAAQDRSGWVRALVFPLEGAAPTADGAAGAGLEVQLTGHLPSGVRLFSKTMQLQQGGGGEGGANGSGLLFAAQADVTISCVASSGGPAAHCRAPSDHVLLQVSVAGPNGRSSRSPVQPAALRCEELTHSHQRCWAAPWAGEPLPMQGTLLEWVGLALNWPIVVHR